MKRSLAPSRIAAALREVVLLPLHLYRLVSPALPPSCRYYPSCSAYAVQAVRELGIVRGGILAGWRVLRCNPWSPGGVDELSDRRLFCAHGELQAGRSREAHG